MSGRFLLTALSAILVGGCMPYTALHAPASLPSVAPTRFVRLHIVDRRAWATGGEERTSVGARLNGYGDRFPLFDRDPEVVARRVREVVTAALARNGIGVSDSAAPLLIVEVRNFWVEGSLFFQANVGLHYELQLARGKTFWEASVLESRTSMGGLSGSYFSDLLDNALAAAEQTSSTQMAAPMFQHLVY